MKKAIVIDDSVYMRSIVKDNLKKLGFEIVGEAGNGENAIDLCLDVECDLITLDNILPDMIGIDICKVLCDEKVKSKIVMISAVGQESIIEESKRMGACGYLLKPFTTEDLEKILKDIKII